MAHDPLLKKIQQAQSLAALDLLLNRETLKGNLAHWLLFGIDNNWSQRTLETCEYRILDFIEAVGDTPPKNITPNMISLYRARRKQAGNKGKGLSDSSCLDIFRTLHTFFEYLISNDVKVLEHSPMEGMKTPKVTEDVIIPYTREQVKNFLHVCDHNKRFTAIRNKALFLLYVSTGLRRKEMWAVELEHVDIVHQTIFVPEGKGKKQRIVGFGKSAKRILMEYYAVRQKRVRPGVKNLWLTEEGTALGYSGIGQAIVDYLKLAGIKIKHSTHALRHTFATESLKNGASEKYVQELMGHKTDTMTKKYQKTVDSIEAVKHHNEFAPDDKWSL